MLAEWLQPIIEWTGLGLISLLIVILIIVVALKG